VRVIAGDVTLNIANVNTDLHGTLDQCKQDFYHRYEAGLGSSKEPNTLAYFAGDEYKSLITSAPGISDWSWWQPGSRPTGPWQKRNKK
jgi:hypothetical protein